MAGDSNQHSDLFVRDRQTNHTIRVSLGLNGTQPNQDSLRAALSANGRYVAYDSGVTNLVPGDTNGVYDVFVSDRDSNHNGVFDEPGDGRTVRVSVDNTGAQG